MAIRDGTEEIYKYLNLKYNVYLLFTFNRKNKLRIEA